MPVSLERFGSEGHFLRYNPFPPLAVGKSVFTLQCRSCGFEPEDVVIPPKRCLKCHGQSWERFVRSGSTLDNADRYFQRK